MKTETITTSRAAILDGLRRFISQRSGIDARNYQRDYRDKEGAAAFRADYRGILRDGREARALLEWIERTPSISAEAIAARATPGARLSLSADGTTWHYTAGQYFAVEYRAAACRTLSGLFGTICETAGNSRRPTKSARPLAGISAAASLLAGFDRPQRQTLPPPGTVPAGRTIDTSKGETSWVGIVSSLSGIPSRRRASVSAAISSPSSTVAPLYMRPCGKGKACRPSWR